MNLVVALAVLAVRADPDEAVYAATAGGGRALRRDDVGVLRVGARADLHVLDAPSHDYLAYRPRVPMTHAVFRRGLRWPDAWRSASRGGAWDIGWSSIWVRPLHISAVRLAERPDLIEPWWRGDPARPRGLRRPTSGGLIP